MTQDQKDKKIRKVITLLTFSALFFFICGFVVKVISSFYDYPLRLEAVVQILGGMFLVLITLSIFISSIGIHLREKAFEKKLKGLYGLLWILLFGFPGSYVLVRGIVELITGQPVPVPIINLP